MLITLTLQVDNDLSETIARALQNVAEHVGNHGYGIYWETAETWQGTHKYRVFNPLDYRDDAARGAAYAAAYDTVVKSANAVAHPTEE